MEKLIKFLLLLQDTYHKFSIKRKTNAGTATNKILVIYRISDGGLNKKKPAYVTKEACLHNAVTHFSIDTHEWIVIADNVNEQTCQMIQKYVPSDRIERSSLGNKGALWRAISLALERDDETIVYLMEDDYIHRTNSSKVLVEAFKLGEADYVTLYDHPDKYGYEKGYTNIFVKGGEKTKVFVTENAHWKITNSTPQTYAVKVKTLRKDKNIIRRWTIKAKKIPNSFAMFTELRMRHGRKIINPIPSYSTHGETDFLAPLIDWEKEV